MAGFLVREREAKAQGIRQKSRRATLGESARRKKITAPAEPTLAQILGRKPVEREEKAHAPLSALTQGDVSSIIGRWRGRYALNTVRKMVSAIKAPLREANPYIRLPRLPSPPLRGVTATPEEAERAITAAAPALKLMLMLAYDSGLRYSECLSLTRHNWNAEAHTITFEGKGGYTRTVPVSARTEAIFSVLTDTNREFIQQLQEHKQHYTLNRQWARLRRALGMSHINIHDFRRTIATRLYAQSKDLRAPQALLGHKWLSSTIRYIAPIGEPALRDLLNDLIRPYKPRYTQGEKIQ